MKFGSEEKVMQWCETSQNEKTKLLKISRMFFPCEPSGHLWCNSPRIKKCAQSLRAGEKKRRQKEICENQLVCRSSKFSLFASKLWALEFFLRRQAATFLHGAERVAQMTGKALQLALNVTDEARGKGRNSRPSWNLDFNILFQNNEIIQTYYAYHMSLQGMIWNDWFQLWTWKSTVLQVASNRKWTWSLTQLVVVFDWLTTHRVRCLGRVQVVQVVPHDFLSWIESINYDRWKSVFLFFDQDEIKMIFLSSPEILRWYYNKIIRILKPSSTNDSHSQGSGGSEAAGNCRRSNGLRIAYRLWRCNLTRYGWKDFADGIQVWWYKMI